MPSVAGEGGASSGAFINLHVFRRENHFLQPLGECVHGHVRREADLQQRAGYITPGPHAHNNHRRLLVEATTDLLIYRPSFSISFYPTTDTL